MQAWALLQWWYGAGWMNELERQAKFLYRVEDYFSFGNLFRTLFQPFKQIDATPRKGGLEVQFHAWLDKMMSRFIGAAARLILLLVGGAWWVISALISVCWLLVWPFLPAAPLVGLIFTILRVGVVA